MRFDFNQICTALGLCCSSIQRQRGKS